MTHDCRQWQLTPRHEGCAWGPGEGLVVQPGPRSPGDAGLLSREPTLLAAWPSEAGPGVGRHWAAVAGWWPGLSALHVDRPWGGAVVSTFWG